MTIAARAGAGAALPAVRRHPARGGPAWSSSATRSRPPGTKSPARSTSGKLGVTWGHIGVAIFFVTSGYLVTQSWHRRPEGGGYPLKRLLRIWPAFLVVIGLSVFVVGPDRHRRRASQSYFTDGHTWGYLLHNASCPRSSSPCRACSATSPSAASTAASGPCPTRSAPTRAARPGHVAAAALRGCWPRCWSSAWCSTT